MFKDRLLENKVILITGGATGLGRAMALRFGELGAGVGIMSRKEENLKLAHEEFESRGIKSGYAVGDVRKPDEIKAAVNKIERELGGINVLINNAAGNFISPTEKLSPNAVDSILDIVLHGTMYCTIEMGKRWIEGKIKGTVLNIVTTYAFSGSGYVVPSAAAKAGVLAVTRSLAAEWGKHGIRHVAIAPGAFPTEGAWSRLAPTPDLSGKMREKIPAGRFGTPEELANLASFLISDQASFINGEAVIIDGGEFVASSGQFNFLSGVTDEQWNDLRKITGGKRS
ncbi:MAG: SDR family oxidoreductase [Candidatus Thermoplasmatota archaeon]|nr:SDR family oxidoreductase [Candidatus Thermoplasmatota archaeon]